MQLDSVEASKMKRKKKKICLTLYFNPHMQISFPVPASSTEADSGPHALSAAQLLCKCTSRFH